MSGIPKGYGEYVWIDGKVFEGDFKNGFRHGYGMWKGPVIKINKSLKHHS